jgi:hypothetical protein
VREVFSNTWNNKMTKQILKEENSMSERDNFGSFLSVLIIGGWLALLPLYLTPQTERTRKQINEKNH